MRIVKAVTHSGDIAYIDIHRFIAVVEGKGYSKLLMEGCHEIDLRGEAGEILRAWGMTEYIAEEPLAPERGLSDADRTAIEKTRTGPMGAGELEAPEMSP